MNEYMNFCFEVQHFVEEFDPKDPAEDEEHKFPEWWATQVSEKFAEDGITHDEILGLYSSEKDTESYEFGEKVFWYGDGLGFDQVPALFINGAL